MCVCDGGGRQLYGLFFLPDSKMVYSLAYTFCYTKLIVVILCKSYFWNNLIIHEGGVNQHEPGNHTLSSIPSSNLMIVIYFSIIRYNFEYFLNSYSLK